MKTTHKILLLSIFCFLLFHNAYSQDIPANIKQELEGYESQIEKYKKDNNNQQELTYLNKAAFLCWENQLYSKSIDHFKRVLELSDNLKNQNGVLLSTNYIGMIYDEMQDHNSSINYFKKGLSISRKINAKDKIASSLINLAQSYQLNANYIESNKSALEGVELAKEINSLKLVRSFYGIVANNYQKLGNSEKSIEYFELFASIDKYLKAQEIKDIKQQSATDVNKAQQEKKLTEKELLIKLDKLKETEDSLAEFTELSKEQQMQLELKESKIREQGIELKLERLLKTIFIWGFVVIFIFLGLILIFYRKIRNQKNQIEEQRDVLDLQNKKINSSIQYAQNIQRAILPVKNQIRNLFESFIIYKPKDIVSGDFYWFTKLENTAFLAAVDCTGHGVPGAFMSMIGNSLLNEIVLEKRIKEPAKILSLLNKKIIDALRQEETDNADGMDVCFIAIDLTTKKITFSGAKRPLYIYKKKTSEFEEIKGARISIGGTRKSEADDKFNDQMIQAETGDILYLSSDGLTDQNNSARKRFGSNRLKEIILKNITEAMDIQKEIIENELKEFQKDEEQRDDITLIGIKIN